MSSTTASASATETRDFSYFVEIIDAFKNASESAAAGNLREMKVGSFTDAMTLFLRIFDAFSNPFFSDVVKRDVQGNINVSNCSLIYNTEREGRTFAETTIGLASKF